MKSGEIFDLIFKIILLILAIVIIIWELQLLFGGSPVLEEFNLALITLFRTLMIHY